MKNVELVESNKTTYARQFMLKAIKCISSTGADQAKVNIFFKKNSNKLNESLLERIPLIFKDLIKNKEQKEQKRIAMDFFRFGNLVGRWPLGNQALNQELRISAYQASIDFYTFESIPELWAMIQNAIGTAYSLRIIGEKVDNHEKAINAYNSALKVYTLERFSEEWARVQNNLGNAYAHSIVGDRNENIEESIRRYNFALQVYTLLTYPEEWARVQNNLGNSYMFRLRGEKSENIKKSFDSFKNSLFVYTRYSHSEKWASVLNNLGNLYRESLWPGLEETSSRLNSQESDQNLSSQKRKMKREKNLVSYFDGIQKSPNENKVRAVAAYREALTVYTREKLPQRWAKTQGNLAEVLIKWAVLNDSSIDMDKAINLLQKALEATTPNSSAFIHSQYRLGNALTRRYNKSQNPKDLQQALQAYKIALDAISPEHYDRQQIWQAIPSTQAILGSRLVRDGQWQKGLQLLLDSIQQLKSSNDILIYANALYQTGRAYETLSDWDNARLYYRDSLRLYEQLNDLLGITQSKAGFGSVLVSLGYLDKGLSELAQAAEGYHRLQRPDKAAEVESLYEAAKRAMERQVIEVSV